MYVVAPSAIAVCITLFVVVGRIMVGASGWALLPPRTLAREAADDVARFCTVEMARGRWFVSFRSCVTLARRGTRIEMRATWLPFTYPRSIELDAATLVVLEQDRYSVVREPSSAVRIRLMGAARTLVDRALREAETARLVAPTLLAMLLQGTRDADQWIGELRTLGTGHSHRGTAAPSDELWRIVEADRIVSRVRLAAAVALEAGGSEHDRARMKAIARRSPDPILRDALEQALVRDAASLVSAVRALERSSG